MNNINITTLSEEELSAVIDLISKMREEKRKTQQLKKARTDLQEMVISTIDVIGLEETKRIIREINRDLRGR